MGRKRGMVSGTSIKDTWTKPKGGRIKGGKWGWLGSGGMEGREMETTILDQQKNVKKIKYKKKL